MAPYTQVGHVEEVTDSRMVAAVPYTLLREEPLVSHSVFDLGTFAFLAGNRVEVGPLAFQPLVKDLQRHKAGLRQHQSCKYQEAWLDHPLDLEWCCIGNP